MKTKKQMIVFLVFSLLMVSITACAFKTIKHGTEIKEEQLATIIDGQTTKQDIFIEFGDPSKAMDNEKVFSYTWTRGSKSNVLIFGGGSAYTKSLVIVFNDNDVVKSHRITRGTTKEGAVIGD